MWTFANNCRQILKIPPAPLTVTVDKNSMYFRNPWNQASEPVVKHERFEPKVMLRLWWDVGEKGGTLHLFRVNAGIYVQQQQRIYWCFKSPLTDICQSKTRTATTGQCPSTRSSVAKCKLEGLEAPPQTAYNPELTPSAYHFFSKSWILSLADGDLKMRVAGGLKTSTGRFCL